MALPKVFTKTLGAASSTSIILASPSQNASAGVALTLNGSTTPYLSTTASSAVLPGVVTIPVASVTGLVVGETVSDSTTSSALVKGTTVVAVDTTSVNIWPPVAGSSGIGSGDTLVFTGPAIIDTATASNNAIGRRVVLAYGGSDANFTVVGTNSTGNITTDTIVGASGAGQSNLDFVTVTSITPVTSGPTGITAGTNGVGSSPWWTTNFYSNNDVNIGLDVEVVSGSVNYTVQHTYDDPNNLQAGTLYPEAFNHPVLSSQNASLDGAYTTPIAAVRVLINSGTGELRMRIIQSGIG
jgi:hypothetical protein